MLDLIYRFDPTNTEIALAPKTADEAWHALVRGNSHFAKMTDVRHSSRQTLVLPFDPQAFGWGVAGENTSAQAPFAAVLACSDARIPTEMVFSKGCNELFVVRVAGNVLGYECLGSLRYAATHVPASLKLLVVLAHTKCGAVSEAVDLYLDPSRYLDFGVDQSIRSIEDQILVAVRVAAISMEVLYGSEILHRPECRAALLETAVVLNAAWSAYCLRKYFQAQFPDLGVMYGVYDLVTRYVRLPLSLPGELTDEEKGLFAPPEDVEGFRQLSRRICGGQLVQNLLRAGPRAA